MHYYILRPVYKLIRNSDLWELSWSIEGTCTSIADAKRQGFVAPVLSKVRFAPEHPTASNLRFTESRK